MPAWRREAIERFPDIADDVEQVNTEGLGHLLSERLAEALHAGNFDRAHEVVAFATWLQRNPIPRGGQLSIDVLNDALVEQSLRSVLWKAVTRDEFETLLPMIRSFLDFDADALSELERELPFMVR